MASPAVRRLTDLAIRNKHRPKAARYEVPDGGQRGLYLVVHPSGQRSFCVRYRFNGVPRKLTLKSGLALTDARKAAADAMYEIEKGSDPAVTRKEARAKAAAARADTVEAICENFARREGRKLRTLNQMQRTLRRLVYPALGSRPVADVRRSEINRMLDTIEDTSGERSAELALQYLRRVFNWHAVQTDDFRSPIVKGMSRYSVAEHRRERVLNDDEIRQLWKATEPGDAFSALVRFLLLTGARSGEAAGLTRAEIAGNAWHLPAARNKTKTDLLRPLSKAALVIVEARPRIGDSPYVFTATGRRPLHLGWGKQVFAAGCNVAEWRLHDLRRTARTLLSRAGVAADTCERCLGHALPAIRSTYDKHDYQREMLAAFEALAALIKRIVNPPSNVVTPMRRRG